MGGSAPIGRSGGDDPAEAGEAALKDVTPHDDALASAWYRTKVLPVLVAASSPS